jgi:hypothetical protein
MKTNNSNISEVSTVGKNDVERDTGNTDIAAVAESLAAGGMDSERDSRADVEGRCGSSARAICAT